MEKRTPSKSSNNKVIQSIIEMPPSKTDPDGSYTGKPIEKYELPVQDADDL